MAEIIYRLPAGFGRDQLLQILQPQFTCERATTNEYYHQYLDSFDWRLFQKDWVLAGNGEVLHLYQLGQSGFLAELKTEIRPSMVADLPDSPLKERLAPILGERALLTQAEVYTTSTIYQVLAETGNIVGQMAINEIRPSPDKASFLFTTYLYLTPVSEDDKEINQLLASVVAEGGTAVTWEDVLQQAMAQNEKSPGTVVSKPRLQLDPDLTAVEAVRRILRAELEVMQANEPYIPQDLDAEFLHDYRVALRRTRAILVQMPGVFPEESRALFRKSLQRMGHMTNELRDLDVFLLTESSYSDRLPDSLREDISVFYEALFEERTAVFQQTVVAMNAPGYRQIIGDWKAFLDELALDRPETPNANLPIITLARQQIYRRYRRILKEGKLVLTIYDQRQMHRLRIECKKLRYLLEVFDSLFPPEEMSLLITQLKKLQTSLGNFNDYCVQEAYLLRIAGELPVQKSSSRQGLLAIGALIAILNKERLQIKAEFADVFNEFTSAPNRERYKQLFKISRAF